MQLTAVSIDTDGDIEFNLIVSVIRLSFSIASARMSISEDV